MADSALSKTATREACQAEGPMAQGLTLSGPLGSRFDSHPACTVAKVSPHEQHDRPMQHCILRLVDESIVEFCLT